MRMEIQLQKEFRRRELHEAGTGHHAGRTCSDRQGLSGQWKNYGEMALKYKVSYQQVRTWTLRFEEMGESGLEDRRGKRKKDQVPRTELEKAQIEIEQLKHKLYLAEMERELLKNWTRSRGEMPFGSETGPRLCSNPGSARGNGLSH